MGFWGGVLAVAVAGVGLMRLSVSADPRPRPRLARWSFWGSILCFWVAAEMLVCRLLLGDYSQSFWPYLAGGVAALAAALAASWPDLRRRLSSKVPLITGPSERTAVTAREMTVWRYADAVVRRFRDELHVDFDRPSKYDLGSWRSDDDWDARYYRFCEAFEALERVVVEAPVALYVDYADACAAIREVVGATVQKPVGKYHYLDLRQSRVVDRLAELVEKDRSAEPSKP